MISINSSSLGEQIEEAIREEILSGELIPGQRLSIDELAQRWGVSSMPVRDAVRRLEVSGFLIVAPRRGVFVSKFDQTRFKNIIDIRSALECLAIELPIESIPEAEIDAELEAMMLRINQQLRCQCGVVYSEHLEACTTCQAPNPLYT